MVVDESKAGFSVVWRCLNDYQAALPPIHRKLDSRPFNNRHNYCSLYHTFAGTCERVGICTSCKLSPAKHQTTVLAQGVTISTSTKYCARKGTRVEYATVAVTPISKRHRRSSLCWHDADIRELRTRPQRENETQEQCIVEAALSNIPGIPLVHVAPAVIDVLRCLHSS